MLDGINYRAAVELHKFAVDQQSVRGTFQVLRQNRVCYFRDGGDPYGVSRFANSIAADDGIDYVTPIFAIHKKGLYGNIIGPAYDSIPEFIKLMARAKCEVCDFIKLIISGILSFDSFGELSCPSIDRKELSELVQIVHAEGLRVMAHVNGSDAIKAANERGCPDWTTRQPH